jgi:RNA-binding protein
MISATSTAAKAVVATIDDAGAPSGAFKRRLKSLAMRLDPAVHVGHDGLSDPVLAAVRAAIAEHELIKVRFTDHKDERRQLAARLAEACDALLVQVVGHVAVLYRPAVDPARRRIGAG